MENSSKKLQEVLVKDLIDRIENGEIEINKDGEAVRISAPASVLTAAVNYLKSFPPEKGWVESEQISKTLERYKNSMPFPTQTRQ